MRRLANEGISTEFNNRFPSTVTYIHTTFTFHSSFSFVFFLQLGLSPLLFCDSETAEKKMEEMNDELSPKGNNGLSGSRLCTVEKDPLGFGFRLDSLPQRHETFISEV